MGGMVCRVILDVWHGTQLLVHSLASLEIDGQTNRSFKSRAVDRPEG